MCLTSPTPNPKDWTWARAVSSWSTHPSQEKPHLLGWMCIVSASKSGIDQHKTLAGLYQQAVNDGINLNKWRFEGSAVEVVNFHPNLLDSALGYFPIRMCERLLPFEFFFPGLDGNGAGIPPRIQDQLQQDSGCLTG